MTTPLIIDVVTIAILVFSALRGRRRGLIKTIAGIVALMLAFSIAGFLAKETAPYISEKYVSPYIGSVIEPETVDLVESDESTDPTAVSEIFLKLGVSESLVTDALSDFYDAMTKSIVEPIVAMTNSVAYKLTYSLLFVIYFIISLLLISLLFKLLNLASKIPGVNFVNKALGLILGFMLGYLIVMVVSYILLKLGIFLSDELLSETHILKFVMEFSFASLFNSGHPISLYCQ